MQRISFTLSLTGTVNLLEIVRFDASFTIAVSNGNWYLRANATMKLFGLAGMSGSVELWSNGDFNVNLSGYLQIGSSSFGIRGDFGFHVESRTYLENGVTYYRFNLSVSADVSVRAFGFTIAGAGISASFGLDTKTAGADGRVKVELSIEVRIRFLFWTFRKTASFTLGYLQFPRPTYLAGWRP